MPRPSWSITEIDVAVSCNQVQPQENVSQLRHFRGTDPCGWRAPARPCQAYSVGYERSGAPRVPFRRHSEGLAGDLATCDPSEGTCGPRPRPHRAPVLVTPWLSRARPDADRARRVWSPDRGGRRRPRRGHDRVNRQALDQARARDVAGSQRWDRDLAGVREGLAGRARPRRRRDRPVGQHGAVGVGRTFVGLGLLGRWHRGVPAEMPDG